MGSGMRVTRRHLQQLGVPAPKAPYTVHAWCQQIAAARSRPIYVMSMDFPSNEPGSWWRAKPRHDIVYIDRQASPLAQNHSILHEVAHILADHDGAQVSPTGQITQDPDQERDAEVVAVAMSDWLSDAGRCESARQRAATWVYRRRAHWHVDWLQAELRRTIPALDSVQPVYADRPLPLWGSWRASYRRVVDIHDVLRTLRRYMPAEVWERAADRASRAGLGPVEVRAVADAAAIRAGMRSYAETAPAEGPVAAVESAAGDLDAEVHRLAAVVEAMRDSPYVAAEWARWVAVGR